MQSLNGTWKLALDSKNIGRQEQWFAAVRPEAQDAPVPGIIQQVFPDCYGVAWYWRTFTPQQNAGSDERYLLSFNAVDYIADVWVNGQPVGGHEGSETPFVLDVTGAIEPGQENLLAVRVLNPTDDPIDGVKLAEIPHRNKEAREYMPGRSYNVGGIIDRVTLTAAPAVRITDIFARPQCSDGSIPVTVTVHNDTGKPVEGQLAAVVGQAAGGSTLTEAAVSGRFDPGDSTHELVLKLDEFERWDLDNPALYRVEVELTAGDGRFVHSRMVRCGFRELCIKDGYFHLNGRRIFLKSTHTGNHFPIAQIRPVDPDLMRRDCIMLKASGYNCIRFIAGMSLAEQMDFCDELGLMVYEECLAGWCLADSPDMKRRFDLSVREMVLRDRNHPSITIWGLLNETPDGPVFRHAVDTLGLVRSLDNTRLVLLASGRWDCQPSIGSVSNPGSDTWQYEWGIEGPNAKAVINTWDLNHGGYFDKMGDAHAYPAVPHPPVTINFLKNLGKDTKPVFLSEYGIGSMLNVIRGTRKYEEWGARPDLSDATLFRTMAEKLENDWKRWGLEGTYAFTEHLLHDSEALHARWRSLGFDLIRCNPKICGFNLTGILDHGITGEGAWRFWREWKPGICDVLSDGWAPLRWCLFVDPMHGYAGRRFKIEVHLANEGVLGAGEYPVRLAVQGPKGKVWEKRLTLTIAKPPKGQEPPLAMPVFCEEVELSGPAGEYLLAAEMEHGGAPTAGRKTFFISDPASLPKVDKAVTLFGVDERVEEWLKSRGVKVRRMGKTRSTEKQVILVGSSPSLQKDEAGWRRLLDLIARGSVAVFAYPDCFARGEENQKVGKLERKCAFKTSVRTFPVENAAEEEWEVFSNEYWDGIHYLISELPNDTYKVELGFCEGYQPTLDMRVFNVEINGKRVLEDFDIVKEAGGWKRAVTRSFDVPSRKGEIEIKFGHVKSAPSLCRLRVYNGKGKLVVEDAAVVQGRNTTYWLPLQKCGQVQRFADWLYHKECVAKRHPVFDGIKGPGIMDWDYYGPVISNRLLVDQDEPEEVLAAAFATGYATPGGYASGIMMAVHRFGHGRFILNTFNILENVDSSPAADRLTVNLLNYAAGLAEGKLEELPRNFDETLKALGYTQ